MTAPIHRWKERVTYGEGFNGKSPRWTFDGKPCWLASGLYDRNGKEIFEGDIVKEIFPPDCANYDGRQLVIFRRGKFLLVRECYWAQLETCGAKPLSWAGSNGIEVIGHIAEEQS